jgi:hypothetical protein
VRWDPVTATATVAHDGESRRYVLGVPGDQLVLGDWDGDRVRTPALYRSTTGEVWAFDRWAAEGAPAGARPLGRLEAWRTVRVEHHDGRDVVVAVAPAA